MNINANLILEYSKDLNVLYVEDDKELRNSTTIFLNDYFKLVDTAENGEDGYNKYREYANENGDAYDIVISDIKMPQMDGIEMCTKIRSFNHEQAIIFITAHSDSSYLLKSIELGVKGFITKPIQDAQLKYTLYTTSQSISDRKVVEKHYKQIEDTNILSGDKVNLEYVYSPKDVLDSIVPNTEAISHTWVNHNLVQANLKKYEIDLEFFRSHYGVHVIEYFIEVIKEKKDVGQCPAMMLMLEFFKNKNLQLTDIFIICVEFKNTITSLIFAKYSFNSMLYEKISFILDKNFEGVIRSYLELNGFESKVKKQAKVKEPEKQEEITVNEEINYLEYIIDNDIYELEDLEDEIDSLAVSVTMNHSSTLDEYCRLGEDIRRYGTILSNYPIFSELGACIVKLGVNLYDNSQLLFDDREKMSNISALVEGFVNDLIVWRKEIFQNNIPNHDFLNDSFFSNVDTIIMFIEYDETAEDEVCEEIDFF
ncbi:response regulator [Sulfurimonas sp.]|nr:response regulator [Sulfurimonas sp.]